ncbi:MAG: hypothetical protein ACK54T_03555 [bacterium]|jgi:hypothetical protein
MRRKAECFVVWQLMADELWKALDDFFDAIKDVPERWYHGATLNLDYSPVKLYLRGDMRLQDNLRASIGGEVRDFGFMFGYFSAANIEHDTISERNVCRIAESYSKPAKIVGPNAPAHRQSAISGNCGGGLNGMVFISDVDLGQEGERVVRATSLVRLEGFDEADHAGINAPKSGLHSLVKCPVTVTDGEVELSPLRATGWQTTGSVDDIVQGASGIIGNFANDETPVFGTTRTLGEDSALSWFRLLFNPNGVGARLNELPDLQIESLEMRVCPIQFAKRIARRGHEQSSQEEPSDTTGTWWHDDPDSEADGTLRQPETGGQTQG